MPDLAPRIRGFGQGLPACVLKPQISPFPVNQLVIIPTAPPQPVTCNNGHVSNSWFDILQLRVQGGVEEVEASVNQEDIAKRAAWVVELAQWVQQTKGLEVHLGGLSQGAMTTFATVLQSAFPFKSAVCLSGYRCARVDWVALDKAKLPPIFVYHGQLDELVNYAAAKATYDHLQL